MRLISFTATLLLTPSLSFAFFCPSNFNQIQAGDSPETVTAQCGKPDTQKESTKPNENIPQEWSYYVPQTVSANTNQQAQGTLKASIAFDKDGNVINITVNGIGVGATTLCGNTVQLGDTRDSVKANCGEPSFINKQNNYNAGFAGPPPDNKIIEFDYNGTTPAKLIFQNGKLQAPSS